MGQIPVFLLKKGKEDYTGWRQRDKHVKIQLYGIIQKSVGTDVCIETSET